MYNPSIQANLVEHDEALYKMTTEQAKGYQAYLSANAKSYSERILMTREMRESADRERAAKNSFTQVPLHGNGINVV
jgi:hypothetical protein